MKLVNNLGWGRELIDGRARFIQEPKLQAASTIKEHGIAKTSSSADDADC